MYAQSKNTKCIRLGHDRVPTANPLHLDLHRARPLIHQIWIAAARSTCCAVARPRAFRMHGGVAALPCAAATLRSQMPARVPCKLSAIETQRLDVHSCREGVLAQVKLNGLTQIAISSGYQSHSRSIGERSRLTSNSPLPKASLHKLSMHTLPHICPSVAL